MAETIYALCALTAVACAGLLARGYRRGHARLLLWSSIAFALLALNSVLLYADLVLIPEVDLSVLRHLTALAGVAVLLVGFVWETR